MNSPEMTSTGPPEPAEDRTPSRRDWISLAGLLFVQTQNAFNDNLVKFVLIGLGVTAAGSLAQGSAGLTAFTLNNIEHVLGALIPLPFILFAPIAGFLSDRFSKKIIITWCLISQLGIFVLIALSVLARSIPFAVTGFFLLAAQSTFFSPAKMGILKEFVGSGRLGMVNGLMQMLSMFGILGGMFLGGLWFDHLLEKSNAASPDATAGGGALAHAWHAALVPIVAVGVAALVPLAIARCIRPTPAHPAEPFRASIFVRHFVHLRYVFRQRVLRLTSLAIAYYWLLAYFVALILVSFGKELHPDLAAGGVSSASSRLTMIIGGGLIVGSSLVSVLSRRRIELGMVPFGGLGLAIALLGVGVSKAGTFTFEASLAFLGFASGFYIVPLTAYLQDQAEEDHRGRVLSANNLLISLTGVAAILIGLGLKKLGLSPSAQVLAFAVPTFLLSVLICKMRPRHVLRFILVVIIQAIYRVKTLHADRVPKKGGALMICNHVSYVDALLLGAACPREVRFVMVERFMNLWWLGWFLRLFDVIPISPTRSREALRATAEALRAGSIVCVFPEGQLSRTGLMNELKKGFELIARQADVPVLPVYLDAIWGSIFSFERDRFVYKIPRRFPYGVTINFGTLIPAREATRERAREVLQDLSAEAFARRRPLRENLATALVRALKKRPSASASIDLTGKRVDFSRAAVLGTAEVIAHRWRRENAFAGDPGEERVGIVLPHGAPAIILITALVFCNRVPVVFPLTSAPRRSDMEKWEIRTVISSRRLRARLPDFPWPEGFVDMAETFREVSRARLLGRWLAAYVEPVRCARWRAGRCRGDSETPVAGYVAEEPDGGHRLVTLSSRQIIANVEQLAGAGFFRPRDTILSEAPASTPEGNMMSLWYPLLSGSPLVTVSLAAEDAAILRALDEEQVRVFLPGAARWDAIETHAGPPPAALRLVLSFDRLGLDADARDAVSEKLGATLAPGSAHPGLGVVVSLSMPDPAEPTGAGHPQVGAREGAAGRLLPGLAARIESEKGERLSLEAHGRLLLRGACLPDTEGWLDVHQRAHFDRDGFLYLE